jgi:hypothetical protein
MIISSLVVFHFIIFRVYYLPFVEAVILFLKHATYLRLLNQSHESALFHAAVHYQEANIDLKIQQHLAESSQKHSVELFAEFIMATDISLFILPSLEIISHRVCTEPTHWHPNFSVPSQPFVKTHVYRKDHWFKQFLDPLRKITRKDN